MRPEKLEVLFLTLTDKMFSETTPNSKIFACSKSIEFAEKIAEKYGTQLGEVKLSYYSDGEFQPSFEESIRGARVFLICSTFPNSDNLMELLLTAKIGRASCRERV